MMLLLSSIAWWDIIIYLITGVATGFIAGLFGVGGGTIVVPVMMMVLEHHGVPPHYIMPLSVGTSLATVLFTGTSATITQLRMNTLNVSLVGKLMGGMMLGASIGAWFAHQIPFLLYKGLMGFFLFAVSVQMFFQLRPHPAIALPERRFLWGVSSIIGFFSALFGIGGGVLTVPYLVWRRVRINEAVAVASACGLPIALAGALTYAYVGWQMPELPATSTGFVLWVAVIPLVATSMLLAPIGARLSQQLPTATLKKYFAVFLFLVSVRLILSLFSF